MSNLYIDRQTDRQTAWIRFLPPSLFSFSSPFSPSCPFSSLFLLLSSLPFSLSPGVLQTYRHSYFGAGTSHMLIGNLYCYRSAPQLASCYGVTYNYIPSYACSPHSSHVAGVKCIGEYTVVCKSVQEYARVCKSVQEYARVCKSVQECVRVYKLSTFQSCSRSEVYW